MPAEPISTGGGTFPGESVRELAGTAAIVTGSTGNLGSAIAKALAQAGAGVVINGRTSADAAAEIVEEIKAAGGGGAWSLSPM